MHIGICFSNHNHFSGSKKNIIEIEMIHTIDDQNDGGYSFFFVYQHRFWCVHLQFLTVEKEIWTKKIRKSRADSKRNYFGFASEWSYSRQNVYSIWGVVCPIDYGFLILWRLFYFIGYLSLDGTFTILRHQFYSFDFRSSLIKWGNTTNNFYGK